MRLIHRSRAFAGTRMVWSVQDYIKQAQVNLRQQDTNHFLSLHNVFRKLYLRQLHEQEVLAHHQQQLNDIVTMGSMPARGVTEYFHRYAKQYNEGFMRVTFEAIGRACEVSKADNNGTLDNLGYRLFLTTEFSNLTEELKYALRNDKISFSTLVVVLDAFIRMEHVDYEVVRLALMFLQKEISGRVHGILEDWEGDRPFQVEKAKYYDPTERDTVESIRGSRELSTAMSFVRHIYNEWRAEKRV